MSRFVLDVDDVERAWESLPVSDDADSADVTTARDHRQCARLELHEVSDLSGRQIQNDGVVSLKIHFHFMFSKIGLLF